MHLDWSDQDGIAKALLEAYPDQDRLKLTDDSLVQLICSLPGFYGTSVQPGAGYAQSILSRWARLAHHAAGSGGD